MAALFDQSKQNISLHINNCYRENELDRSSTVKKSLTVQTEGNRNVRRNVEYYNLDIIISVGYRLKDLGKKLFAFSKMDKASVASIISAISGLI